jgi:hypothetical protein
MYSMREDSPGRNNKQVSFNRAVKVREYTSSKKQKLLAQSPTNSQGKRNQELNFYNATGGSPMRNSPRKFSAHANLSPE